MLRKITAALLGASCLVSAALAPASAGEHWRTVGGWEVMVDPTAKGCFVSTEYERGTVMRLGIDTSGNKATVYLLFGNQNWKRMPVDAVYNVRFTFDGSWYYDTKVRVIDMGKQTYLIHDNIGAEFGDSFAKYNTLVVTDSKGNVVANVTLRGTMAAVNAMVDCQTEFDSRSSSSAPATPRTTGVKPGISEPPNGSSWVVALKNDGSSIKVDGQLSGQVPVRFVLDTGASGISITREQARAIGARQVGSSTVTYADGRRETIPVVMIPQLTVGFVTVTNIRATVGGDDALLGKNFLDLFSSYEISNARGTLELRK